MARPRRAGKRRARSAILRITSSPASTATLTNGRRLEVRPAPRRAVGPDLIALVLGAGECFGSIDHVWLRVHVKGVRRVELTTGDLDFDPPVSTEGRPPRRDRANCHADHPSVRHQSRGD